jgi:GT2 family glycosyltransferase
MISIVTGTYNRLAMLQRMIASGRKSAGTLTTEFVVVDGGSTDGTQAWCKTQPDIVLIEQGELLGACKAYNAGFSAARGDYVVTSNDDIEFVDDTIAKAAAYLDHHPECGQVAFHNRAADSSVRIYDTLSWNGYLYGQCCITRKVVGDAAGWWGPECRTYAGDAWLGLRCWELGWTVETLPDLAVIDYQAHDALREVNHQGQVNGSHPDNARFLELWRTRLPKRDEWIGKPASRIMQLAEAKQLRSLRFKIVPPGWIPRVGLINALAEYGPAEQVNQDAE